jgi:DNA-binding ferritin-like protein
MEIKFKEKNTTEGKEMKTAKDSNAKVAEFLDCILTSAVIVHKMHLRITGDGSYAAHVALNDLYEDLPEHADEITEKFQGYHGVLITNYPSMDQVSYLKMKPLEFVTWLLNYVEEYRTCFGTVSSIQNLVDELVASISEAKYKLTFLK